MRKSWRRDRQARSISSREGDKKHDSSHGAYSAEEFHDFMSPYLTTVNGRYNGSVKTKEWNSQQPLFFHFGVVNS